MTRLVVFALLVSPAVGAYDSKCRLTGDDCEGIAAAQTPWVVVEHAELWRRTRVLAGLPSGVDQPFTVTTMSNGNLALDDFPSLRPDSLLFDEPVDRVVDIAVFAQLPDLSYSLWDWVSGNEGCPPAGLTSEPLLSETERCHAFKAHMGWLNSTHFMPQAQHYFTYLHGLAVQRAGDCAAMAAQLGVAGLDRPDILQACDREALLIEAQAHHYLQDAWSMGHMWERWGSPEITDLQRSVDDDASLLNLKAVGDAVGRASGIIHGAKAITHLADSMCAPHEGVEFVIGSSRFGGVGDLFLDELYEDLRFAGQRSGLEACATTAMREVYLASAQSFGPPTDSSVRSADLSTCFLQRATNRAIAIGAAIEIPAPVPLPVIGELVRQASNTWLESIGLEGNDAVIYVPLTSEVLTTLGILPENLGVEGLIPEALVGRWHDDMSGIQDQLHTYATLSSTTTELATGTMGSLLGMEANSAYSGVPLYADPPLPWRPEPNSGAPILPSIENAGNLLARTFVDAHAVDWCEAMTRDEPHEFSLEPLREECDSEGDGCEVCEKFAAWHLASTRVADPPLCSVVAPGTLIIDADFIPATDRATLAEEWCRTRPSIRIQGVRTIGTNEPLQLTALVTGLNDIGVSWVGADDAGIFRSAEPGSFIVEVTSRELPSLRTGALVTVRADGEALGTWVGTSLAFDGQDDPPVGSPGTIQIRISENGERLFFDHMAVGSSIVPFGNRYTVDVVGGVLTGDNGLTGGSRRTVDATIDGGTLAGVITLSDGGSTGLNSTIEFTTTRQ